MNNSSSTKRFLIGAIVITLTLAVSLALVSFFAQQFRGESVFKAASLAALSCWVGAILALIVTYIFSEVRSPVAGVLGATACRTGIPLATAILGCQLNSTLAAAGFFGLTVIFFLIALVVETPISVWLVSRPSSEAGAV